MDSNDQQSQMIEGLEHLRFKLHGDDLSLGNFRILCQFLFNLINARSSNKVKVVYRGESFDNLKSKLKMHGESPDYRKLSDFIFLIGEKGKSYWKEYRGKVKQKSKLFQVNDTTIEVFRYIFKKCYEFLKEDIDVVIDFKRLNKSFSDFFCDRGNEQDFIDKIRPLSVDKQLEARDYYLALLHQLGKVGYFNNSIFLSTSTDIRVANRFSIRENRPHSIVFVSWIPQSSSFALLPKFYMRPRTISTIGLPTYTRPFYPRQKEISLKGGLLPHYILGYIKVDTWEMELNPNLFTTEKSFRKILADGFDIDQSSFRKKLTETDYEYFFIVDDNGNHWDERMPM